jgi:hypothetical protein
MWEPSIAEGEVLARLAHLEPLLAGTRVLVVGSPEDARPTGAFLEDRGAARVRCVEDEAAAAAGAGTFDRVVVHPVEGRAVSAERVAALRALLAPGGLLAVAVPGGEDGAGSLLREAFPVVEEAVLVRVSAWAVAPSAARPGDVTWDGSRLGAVRPSSRLFVCGDRPSGLEGVTVTALPAGEPGPDLDALALAEGAAAREEELRSGMVALAWQRDELARALELARATREPAPPGPGTPGGDDLLSP